VSSAKRSAFIFGGLLVIHLGALCALAPALFSWPAVITAALLFYATSALGISLTFHRLLTHRSLRVPRFLEYTLALLGTLALQGGPIDWVSTHRKHHAYADTADDPHSILPGFIWAHAEWLYRPNPALVPPSQHIRWARDLFEDPFYRFLERYELPLQVILGFTLLAVGGWPFVVWGIFVRLTLVYHCTWLVNSAAHLYGYQTYRSNDRSTNCWWAALLSNGEGWHNNHHAFPFSARHGLARREIDITWLAIRTLARLGLATKIKLPTKEMMERMRLDHKTAA